MNVSSDQLGFSFGAICKDRLHKCLFKKKRRLEESQREAEINGP